MPLQQFDERIIIYGAFQFTSSATPGAWVNVTNDVNQDTRLDVIQLCNSDSVDHLVSFDFINYDGTGLSGTVKVPAGAGTDGTAPVDALALLMPSAFHCVLQTNTPHFAVSIGESVTATKAVTGTFWGGAF